MEKIGRSTLEEILIDNGFDLKLQSGKGEKLTIERNLTFIVNGGSYELKCTGYTVTGKEQATAEDLTELYAILNRECESDGEYLLDSIADRFATVAEMREQIAFDNISMDDLLKRYKTSDRFSLTSNYGDVHLDEELAKTVLKELSDVMYKMAESQFVLIPKEERKSLPPFDKLYEEIENECIAHRKKHKKRIEQTGGQSFFCDVFATAKSKYKEPQSLWHIYSAVDFIQSIAYDLKRLTEIEEVAPIDRQLDGLPVLKEALISAKPTYTTHCTTGGSLATVFTFELNDRTRAWLKTHKDDYDFNYNEHRLDDLALYCGNKILFSSCTHEGYHSDCLKEQRRN